MKLLLIDNDMDFRKRFSGYVADGCRGAALTVTGDGDVERPMLDENELILADERAEEVGKLMNDCDESIRKKTILLTPLDKDTGKYSAYGIRYISKFHSAREMISMMPGLYEVLPTERPQERYQICRLQP